MDSTVAAQIDEWREQRNWSRNELAKRAGIDPGYLSRILRGKRPSEVVLRKIAKPLQLTEEQSGLLLAAAGYAVPTVAEILPNDQRATIEAAIRRIPGLTVEFRSRLAVQLVSVATATEALWHKAHDLGDPIPHVPEHGPEHSLAMLSRLVEFFPEGLARLARRREISLALLLQSLWLHDVGIAAHAGADSATHRGEQRKKDLYSDYRTYPKRSENYVRELHLELGLSKEDARVLENLCKHHRESENLSAVAIEEGNGVIPAREQKVLIALLRIADLLDVRPERVATKQKLDEVMANWQVMLEVRGEWLRNLFIARLRRERSTLVAEIRYDRGWGQDSINTLLEAVVRELQGQINLVKDILVDEPDCILLNVRTDVSPDPLPTELKSAMEKVRRSLGRYPSARHFMDRVLDSLDRLLKFGKYDDVRDYVERELRASIGLRPYHVQVQNLCDDLVQILKGDYSEEKQLRVIEQVSLVYRNHKEKAFAEIAAAAKREFCDPNASFLLFGYSECVLKGLGAIEQSVRRSVDVTILEFRAKSLYDSDFRLQYCDGANFALEVRRLGYERIWLAPDASVTAIFTLPQRLASHASPGSLPRRPTHLIVGVNAITPDDPRRLSEEAEDTATVREPAYGAYSTTGYRTIIEMAKKYKAHVYVLAESAKIRHGVEETAKERVHCWLAQDERWAELMRDGIRIFSPLDDQIDSHDISWFITDLGRDNPADLRRKHPASFSALPTALHAADGLTRAG